MSPHSLINSLTYNLLFMNYFNNKINGFACNQTDKKIKAIFPYVNGKINFSTPVQKQNIKLSFLRYISSGLGVTSSGLLIK